MSLVETENLGVLIDRLDNLTHALKLPMPDSFHVKALRSSLPNLVEDFKKAYANELHENPWETHPA